MLANLDRTTSEPPDFYQLNFGYRLTSNQTLAIELISWKYYGPLGLGVHESAPAGDKFPGKVSARGVGLAYQNFFAGRFYGAFHALWMNQDYVGTANEELSTGHQLFLTGRLGYHWALGKSFFLEPSAAVTHWPVNTGLPASFQEREDRQPKFAVEPGLHFGFVF